VTSSEPAVTEPEPEIITPAETSPPPSPETAPLSSGVTVPDLKLGQSARAVLVAPNGDLVPGTWKNASGMIFFKADVPELQFGESYRWWYYSTIYGVFRFGTYKCISPGLVSFVEDPEYTVGPISGIVHNEEVYTVPPGTWW
jgi:hypothetical protein